MKYHAFYFPKLRKMSQNLLSAAVVIGPNLSVNMDYLYMYCSWATELLGHWAQLVRGISWSVIPFSLVYFDFQDVD